MECLMNKIEFYGISLKILFLLIKIYILVFNFN